MRYEPMLAEQLKTDIVPALHDLAKNVLAKQTIESKRFRARHGFPGTERRGSEVPASMTLALVDTHYAASARIAAGEPTLALALPRFMAPA